MKLLQALLGHFTGYRVIVLWEGVVVKHNAHSMQDALEWAAAYPQNALVRIRRRLTTYLVASRNDLAYL